MRSRRGRGDIGAGTVLAVTMMGVLVTVTVATAGVVGIVAGHRRAQTAADLASLAAASTLQEGGSACRRAGVIAVRNGARLRTCQVEGWDVSVLVVCVVHMPTGTMDLRARGRAGPVNRG